MELMKRLNENKTHEVDTFSSRVDDLHSGGILQIIRVRDCSVTWSASIHSIEPGSQVYSALLEELLEGDGDIVDDKHRFSSTDRFLVEEDHTGFRGHVASMCPRS